MSPIDREHRDDLVAGAAAEADRLRDVIAMLEAALARAEAEAALVADWPPERLDAARRALRLPRFADAARLRLELDAARTELDALIDLRRRL
ncbi:MAG: hypothetical protein MUE51_04830 [Thermoleophilia bacterium]|nr:hypothetical protein [Thermoleophilia bacterium]